MIIDGEMTNGEATALVAMMLEIPAERVHGFVVVGVVEVDCDDPACGEKHRVPAVTSDLTGPLMVSGLLADGIMQVVRQEVNGR